MGAAAFEASEDDNCCPVQHPPHCGRSTEVLGPMAAASFFASQFSMWLWALFPETQPKVCTLNSPNNCVNYHRSLSKYTC